VDEVITVLKYLNSDFKTPEDKKKADHQKTLFLLLYGGGLRISEACNLKWKQVHLNEQKILVRGKGNKERYSVLPHFCTEHLNYFKKSYHDKNNEFVFGEQALNPRTGFEWIRQLGAAAGLINNLHPHALRHSYATHLLASGTNLRTLQTLLGHSSLQATEKYTHLSVDHLARLVEQTHPLTKLKLSS
jgi:integrase/recombinase XerC/integrase/recombinase XerD